ncbi:MAG: hypothetical protein QME66_13725 [Candidatus Eisenbacteria bacterium]|nr:hypothetical protein [Candidatus Eisenbacteria bacterium]
MHYYRAILFVGLGIIAVSVLAENDLRDAYESVVVSNLEATAMQKAFDLDRADVSEFMLARINAFSKKGDGACAEEVMGSLLHADPGKGIEWLLDRYGQLSAVGRANMVKSLRHSECKEAYEIVSVLLAHKEDVVNQHVAAVAAGPYTHLRVCDYAYNSFLWMIRKSANLPADLPRGLFPDSSIEDRDRAIKRLVDWWDKESATVLQQKTSLATTRPSLKEKMRTLQKTQH